MLDRFRLGPQRFVEEFGEHDHRATSFGNACAIVQSLVGDDNLVSGFVFADLVVVEHDPRGVWLILLPCGDDDLVSNSEPGEFPDALSSHEQSATRRPVTFGGGLLTATTTSDKELGIEVIAGHSAAAV